jgi:hypothetical protein
MLGNLSFDDLPLRKTRTTTNTSNKTKAKNNSNATSGSIVSVMLMCSIVVLYLDKAATNSSICFFVFVSVTQTRNSFARSG